MVTTIILSILKILGIILLILLGIILMLLLLILFVPVRYWITVHRKTDEEVPVVVDLKVTWLLHILNVAFSYPAAAYVRVRVFCFTVFRSDKASKDKSEAGKASTEKEVISESKEEEKKEQVEEQTKEQAKEQAEKREEAETEKQTEEQKKGQNEAEEDREDAADEESSPKIFDFFKKLWSAIKNIKYTILRICDKIKHIVKNIRYYIKIIQSDTFKRAWKVCSGQVLLLLKAFAPKKLRGTLLIGTGDPASTAQVLAVYGMLYPLIGNHIDITPDFEQAIIEGDLLARGRITVFRLLKTAWIVFFNRDLRRLIKLFKREAA